MKNPNAISNAVPATDFELAIALLVEISTRTNPYPGDDLDAKIDAFLADLRARGMMPANSADEDTE